MFSLIFMHAVQSVRAEATDLMKVYYSSKEAPQFFVVHSFPYVISSDTFKNVQCHNLKFDCPILIC